MSHRHSGRYLGGRRSPTVERPVRALVVVSDSAPGKLSDGSQPASPCSSFCSRALLDGGDDRRVIGRRELRVEHICDYASRGSSSRKLSTVTNSSTDSVPQQVWT